MRVAVSLGEVGVGTVPEETDNPGVLSEKT